MNDSRDRPDFAPSALPSAPSLNSSERPRSALAAYLALISLAALILLCVSWELWLAPLKPHGSALVLKVVPLLFAWRGVWRRDTYTMQWSSMLILAYLAEGVVRAMSDPRPSATLGAIEIVLTLIYFGATLLWLAPLKRAARRHAAKRRETS